MMEEQGKTGTLREHEKFWAFVILVGVVAGLVILAAFILNSNAADPTRDVVYAAKLRIIDAAVGGLIAITGMAAQALFRVSSVDKLSAETALEAARKLPEPAPAQPTEVKVVNTPSDPAHVQEISDHPSEELPEYAR